MSRLPLLGVGGPVAAGGGLTLSFNTSSSSAASTITIPAGANIGDLAVLFDFGFGTSTTVTDVVPTDWTGVANASIDGGSSRRRFRVSRKVLVGGDPGASITGLNAATRNNKVMLVFTPSGAISSVTAELWSAIATGSSWPLTIAAASTAPAITFGMAGADNGTAVFDGTTSPAFTATVANSTADLLAGYIIYNSSPAGQTVDSSVVAGGGGALGHLCVA